MRNKRILLVLLSVVLFVAAATDIYVETPRHAWISLGTIDATASAADSALGVTERDWPTNADLDNVVAYRAGITHKNVDPSYVFFRFKLATNNHDVDIDVWVKPPGSNDLIRIATLDVICGQQDVYGSTTLHYADTCNISNEAWVDNIWTVAPGTDHMVLLCMDLSGFEGVLFHGYGTFDGDCTIEVKEL